MKKIGFITIGQAPRNDIMKDIFPIIEDSIEVLQRGALDNLSGEELKQIAPGQGDTVLVSSLRDGSCIMMAEEKIIGLLQDCIDELETSGVSGIMLLCTGDFRNSLSSKVPLIYPNRILRGLIPALCKGETLTVIVPDEEQKKEAIRQWKNEGIEINPIALSPYESDMEAYVQVAEQIKAPDSNYILMDCMGYSRKMKNFVSESTGKKVILPRTLSAVILKELI